MSNKNLYNYHLISELRKSDDGDFFSLFCCFAEPIITDMGNGNSFDQDVFLKEMKDRYGIEWNENILTDIMPNFVKCGLINETLTSGKTIRTCVVKQKIDKEKIGNEIKLKMDEITKEFLNFQKLNPNLFFVSKSPTEFENVLFEYLSTYDYFVPNKIITTKEGNTTSFGDYSEEMYIIARFIQHVSETNPKVMQLISELAGSVKIGTLLQEFALPTTGKTSLNNPKVFLDNYVILSYLGLCGRNAQENTKNLITRLVEKGARIAIFSHTKEEALESLKAVLENNISLRHGPTWQAILAGETTEDIVRQTISNFDALLGNRNIELVYTDAEIYRSPKFHQICNSLTFHREEQKMAKTRDALSIYKILIESKQAQTSDPLNYKYIFIARNPLLVKAVKKYMIDELGFSSTVANPFILSNRIETLLWVVFGNYNDDNMPMYQLLANSEIIRMLNPKLIEAVREKISFEFKPELSKQYEEMAVIPRYLQLLGDMTHNDPQNLSKYQSGQEIVDALRNKYEEDISRSTTDMQIQHGEVLIKKDAEISSLEQKLDDEERKKESQINVILSKRTRYNRPVINIMAWTIVILPSIISAVFPILAKILWSDGWLWTLSFIVPIVTVTLSVFDKMISKEWAAKKSKKIIDDSSKKSLETEFAALGLLEIYKKIEDRINWDSYSIRESKNSILTLPK